MKSGINKDLDAMSCYDRILAMLASLSSRRFGLHENIAFVNAKTLQDAKFKLKTMLGISTTSYQHCKAFPIHGTGQGSGNSRIIWSFICSTLFEACDSRTYGALFESYDCTTSIRLYLIGFIDDCSQCVNDFAVHPQPTAAQLVQLMQHDAQIWNNLLWSSGGKLELPKCLFHLVETTHLA